jgi:hypothetical protein
MPTGRVDNLPRLEILEEKPQLYVQVKKRSIFSIGNFSLAGFLS